MANEIRFDGQVAIVTGAGAGLGKTYALELAQRGAKYNIQVNSLAPVAASRLTEDIFPPEKLEAAKPELVTPLVVYLVSKECTNAGQIYRAGFGEYARMAIVTGPRVKLSDGKTLVSVEEIRDNWNKISSIEGAEEGRV